MAPWTVTPDPNDVHPLAFTGKIMGGFRYDLKRRSKCYVNDWTEAFQGDNAQVTIASTLFLFFACLAPAIAFGALFDKGTDGQLGAFEMILSSAMSGIVYAFFAGQPLCIMGATGPELAYTLVFYNMCKDLDLEFMPARFWEGMWCALMTIVLALTDSNAICKWVTQFTEDVFSALISLIFIIEAGINTTKEFDKIEKDGALLTVILALGSFGLAMYFRSFKSTRYLRPFLRKVIGNFGVTISVFIWTAISLIFTEDFVQNDKVKITLLKMPDRFEPTMKLSDGKVRPWIVNPFGVEKDFPVWGIFFAIGPAIGLCILGFLDQNLTSLLINRKQNGLRKPPAYHLDLLVCGVFIYPICSLFGLPFTHAATIRSLTHLISLTTFEDTKLADGTVKKVPAMVNEQRWTQLGIHSLIGLSSLLSKVLGKLPVAVLYGIFLFMGISTISGNDLFDRMFLWLIWDTSKYPAYPFLKRVKTARIHLYTFIQFMCLVILYALKSIKQVAVVFPFFLIVICIVRQCLPMACFGSFTQEEIAALDGGPEETHSEREADMKMTKDPSTRDLTHSQRNGDEPEKENGTKAEDDTKPKEGQCISV
jgi:hypothetical protein